MATITTEKLPALEGSEKQVAWAEKVRATAMQDVAETFSQFDEMFGWAIEQGRATQAQADAARTALEAYHAELLSQTQAGWWIDRRSKLERPTHTQAISRMLQDATRAAHS